MKITLDLTSVVVGGAAALALGVVAGFSPQATQLPAQQPRDPTAMMSARPEPRDFVWLEAEDGGQGSPFVDSPVITVPAGKLLVITGVMGTVTNQVLLSIDGTTRSHALSDDRTKGFFNGITLTEGQTVQVRATSAGVGSGAYSSMIGYWADA